MKKKAICQAFGALLAPLSAGLASAAGVYLPRTYLRAYRNAYSLAGNASLAASPLRPHLANAAKRTATRPADELGVDELELRQGRVVRELIIIDAGVPEQERFRRARRPGADVVELSGEGDPLEEMIAVLGRYRDLDEIHLVSHGEAGALRLGGKRIDAATLEANPGFFEAFDRASRTGADLLLYGCDVAAGDGELLEIVRQQTHLDVAASDDATGAAALGGDGELEIRKGHIEGESLFSELALRDYSHVLGPAIGTFTFDNWNVLQYAGPVDYTKDGLRAYSAGTFSGFLYGTYAQGIHVCGYVDLSADARFLLGSDDGSEFGAASVDLVGYYSTDVELIGYRDGAVVGRKSVSGLSPFVYGSVNYTTVDLASGLTSGSFAAVDAIRFSAPPAAYCTGVGIDNLEIVAPTVAPTVTDANVSISGASGTGGSYRIGDTVTATWNNTAGGDNNSTISGVTVDFSEFGGGSAVAATDSAGTWTATYTLVAGAIDATGRDASVTAANAGGSTTTADTTGAAVDTVAPTVTDANIALSGATGIGGVFLVGDTVTAAWNNTAGGDNNNDTISAVSVDYSAFGGGSAVAASNSAGTWTATYTIAGAPAGGDNVNVSVTAQDNAGNSTTTADTTNASLEVPPTVTDPNISISGASGTGGTYRIGDTVTATWNNTAGGDNNSTVNSVTIDFSELGGGSAVAATESSGTWTATYTLVAGAIDATGRNVSVTAANAGGSTTTTADTTGAAVDTVAPTVTDANITLSGATGIGGVFLVGDTVTAAWNNTAGGDNNSDTINLAAVDFSAFGGGSAVLASNSAGTWTATYTVTAASTEGDDLNVSVTAEDNAGNTTTTADTTNASVDAAPPDGHAVSFDDGLINGSEAASISFTFAGAELGASYDYSIGSSGGGTPVSGSGTIASAGEQVGGIDISGLADGTLTLSATLTDDAGNAAGAVTDTATLDTTAPAAPSEPDLAAVSDTGVSNTDDITSDTTPTLLGSAEADATVQLSSDVAGVLGTTTASSGGAWSFTPGTALAVGEHQVTAEATDAAGNTSEPSAALTLTIDVAPPVAADDAATTDEDASVDVDVLANDADAGSSLNPASVTVVTPPAHGSTSVNTANGVITYTPDADYNGVDSFTYTVDDLHGGTSGPGTVSITVAPQNDAPAAAADSATTPEDTAVLIDVAANDTDIDVGDAVDGATISIVTPPADGTAVLESGLVRYTPGPDFVGTDGFTYTIEDGSGAASNVASVVINVSGINDAPQAVDDAATTDEDAAVIVGVLGNDSDIDGALDPATVQVLDVPAHGATAVDAGTGEITYTPEADFNGTDSFTYTVRDDTDASAPAATVTVTVAGVNDAPVAADNAATIQEDVAHVINVLGNDSDVDGDTDIDPASVEIVTPAADGAATVDATTGSITYTPGADFNGADAFAYRVADQAGEWSAPATVTLTVESVNDAPLANDDSATTAEDTAITIDVLANDGDVDGTLDPAAVTIVVQPALGEALAELDGSITYTPDADANGSDHFTYTVADDAGDPSGEAEVTVTVTAVNDAPTITGTPPASVAAGTVYHFTPTLADPDGDALTVSAENLPPWLPLDPDTGALDGMPGNVHVGEHGGILLTVSDGIAEASLPAFSILVEGTLDSDGDGMPDEYEVTQGFDPFDPADGDLDADGDGVTNAGEYVADSDPLQDDYAPVIDPPETVSIDATGLLTAFPVLTAPAAHDDHDGPVEAVLAETPAYLAPGVHEATWRAGDEAGNQAEIEQVIHVRPQVSLAPDQTRAEGDIASVRFLLNGASPVVPLSVAYTVDGTADGADHDLASGLVVFGAGETEKALTFNLVDDGVVEGSETVRVILAGEGNFGPQDAHVLTILEENVAPSVALSIVQDGGETRLLTADGGPVTFTALVDDANPGDAHSYEWQFPGGTVVTPAGDNQQILDPALLAAGVHAVRVVVDDDGAPVMSGEVNESFLVAATAPVLSAGTDSDGDGIDDAAEGYGDDDANGQPDYLDGNSLPNVLNERAGDDGRYLIETQPGLRLALGAAALGNGGVAAGLTPAEAADAGIPADDIENVGGYFDFVVRGLETAGASASIVIPQREPVPERPVYRKYDEGWHDFVEDQDDRLASAPGAAGVCPPPGSEAYTPGLDPGDWCVQLTIEDGGPNDADDAANRAVEDPGGVGRIESVSHTTEGGGGGALGWPVLLGLLGIAGLRRGARGGCLPASRRAAAAAPVAALLLAATFAATSAEVRADDPAFDWRSVYVTGDFGYAATDVSGADLEAAFADLGTEASVASIDETRTAYGIALGYRFDERWTVEAGWLDLGDVDLHFDAFPPATRLAEVYPPSGAGYTFSALYRHPLGRRTALRARVGLLAWQADYVTRAMDEPVDRYEPSGEDLFYSLGADYALAERWRLNLELRQYHFDPEPIRAIAVGVEWAPGQ